MTYLVLARKYRPRSFDTLIGQDHVVRALTHALDTQRLHHAWLFTGTRGVGKTTLSRILAKSLNCETGITSRPCGVCQACRDIDAGRFVDYVELDAASNRGVDEMTQLLEQAVYAPSVGRFKVYMIDEVHMLTGHAFNAMLKTLEEPPAHVKFIIATTDPQKIPVTVLSRCLQFNLKQMPPDAIVGHLTQVLIEEQIPCEVPALRLIAQAAGGSMRDALSLTDQAIAYSAGSVTEEAVRGMLGTIDQRHLVRLLQALGQGQAAAVIDVADELAMRGLSYSGALADLSSLLSRVAIARRVPGALDPSDPLAGDIVALASQLHPDTVQLFYSVAVHSRQELALAPDEYAGFVMACLRMLALVSEAGPVDMPAPSLAAASSAASAMAASTAPSSTADSSVPPASVAPSAPAPSSAENAPVEGSALPASAAPSGDMPITQPAAQPAPAHAEQAATDSAQSNQGKKDPALAQQVQADQRQADPVKLKQASADQGRADQAQTARASADHSSADHASADHASTDQAPDDRAQTSQVQADQAQTNQVHDQAQAAHPQIKPTPANRDELAAEQSVRGKAASPAPRAAPGDGAAPPPWDDASTVQAAPQQMATPAHEVSSASAAPASPSAPQSAPGVHTPDAGNMPAERAKPADDLPSWVSEDIPDEAMSPADQAFMASGDDDDEFETLSDEPFEVPPVAGRPIAAAPSVRAGKRHRLPKLADMTPQQWPELAASLPVTGLAAEVARQSEWLGATDDTIRLRVAVRTLADSASRIRLQTVLCEHYGRAVRIDVVVGVTGEATAHAVAQSVRLANQQAAEQAVADDPFVNALMADFGARVVPASIRHVGGVAGA